MLKVLAGSCSVLGVASVSTRSLPCKGQSQGTEGDPWPEPGLGHLHVESRVVTVRTKPHHSGRIPGESLGLGWGGVVWCGEGWREVQMGFSFPSMWGLWLLHWGSELSFRLFRASSSSFLARGGWWGDDPFFCLHSPPDAAFYYSAGAYLGLSQCFGHTD